MKVPITLSPRDYDVLLFDLDGVLIRPAVRLRRIAGQMQAVERMVDADRHCIDLMHHLAALQAAIGEAVLRSHVQTCFNDGIRNGDERDTRRVDELLAVVDRIGGSERGDGSRRSKTWERSYERTDRTS